MTIIQTFYTPGRYGLGTEFAESEIPIEYSQRFVNRFININGDAEKRQGISQLGDTISGGPTITGLHELIDPDGNAVLMASSGGNIYKLDEAAGTWSLAASGKAASERLLSGQMGKRHIFVNGTDRNFFTEDATEFSELEALIVRGRTSSSATDTTHLTDSNVDNWLQNTFVTDNDLVVNSSLDAFGIVTNVSGDRVTHTAIGSAATGLGNADSDQSDGDFYRIIDLVELNIVEQNSGLDNFATGATGTSAAGVVVSGVNWLDTDIKVGDYYYNTTRSAIAKVSAIATSQLTGTSITSQTANDSFQF